MFDYIVITNDLHIIIVIFIVIRVT